MRGGDGHARASRPGTPRTPRSVPHPPRCTYPPRLPLHSFPTTHGPYPLRIGRHHPLLPSGTPASMCHLRTASSVPPRATRAGLARPSPRRGPHRVHPPPPFTPCTLFPPVQTQDDSLPEPLTHPPPSRNTYVPPPLSGSSPLQPTPPPRSPAPTQPSSHPPRLRNTAEPQPHIELYPPPLTATRIIRLRQKPGPPLRPTGPPASDPLAPAPHPFPPAPPGHPTGPPTKFAAPTPSTPHPLTHAAVADPPPPSPLNSTPLRTTDPPPLPGPAPRSAAREPAPYPRHPPTPPRSPDPCTVPCPRVR
ncbi:hypothetical protein CesoFtcFv8_005685 [Champsocephalus esox]|uniref:Uncharacterized protein n=1 Tax=Champsocephalus esox TaxID=159716 RepID=A0AAN8H9Z2_9TELE|nr:hypothetical protein CesoFtcFv8_005685 [Champsocephalus esox]